MKSRLVSRYLGLLVGLGVAALVLVAPAAAAPPANDTFAGAVTISALPFSATVDTTEATTDADDANANANCGAPATGASVWYAFTPAASTGVSVDVSASSYSAGVIVVTGSPPPGPPNGGTLQINVTEAALPEAAVTVDPTGLIDRKTGVVTVSGTFTCANADFAFVDITVTQQVGRFTITGFGSIFSETCDGQSHPWSVDVTGSNGKFAGGKANVDASMFACDAIECATADAMQTVRLRTR